MKKRILFIINPISGGKKKLSFPALVKSFLDLNRFSPSFAYTEWRGHATSLAVDAVSNGIEVVVSVGGDGTINEVASALEGTDTLMGIVPYGSGNGLARSLNIPLNDKKAVSILNNFRVRKIDSAVLNGRKFFNMAGLGFDAHISAKFANLKHRGLKGYVTTAISEVSTYVPDNYYLIIDGNHYQEDAFMISIANSCQYGNNAYIAPEAEVDDGLLDVCIIKPFPLIQFPVVGYHLFNKTVHKTPYVEIIKGKDIRIRRAHTGIVHLDGEPVEMDKEVVISIKPLSLLVLN